MQDARERWRCIRTNNIERLSRMIRRHARVVGTFPNEKSALMPATTRLKCITDSERETRRYLNMHPLKRQPYRRLAESV